ncbi:hypothetical protein KQX54_004632 [Cotesia glomerata]|uniref:Uncharacterized protein n=1 Tax=Cotesia glomerata TaxID=32391 RepID=A0AAV7I0C1_COTGL|nr:hypothetical protein KQX54_004632 [Cotesia glomerata]
MTFTRREARPHTHIYSRHPPCPQEVSLTRTSEIDHVALAVVGYSPALASRSSLLLSGIKVTATSGPNLLPRQSGTSSFPSLVSSFVT